MVRGESSDSATVADGIAAQTGVDQTEAGGRVGRFLSYSATVLILVVSVDAGKPRRRGSNQKSGRTFESKAENRSFRGILSTIITTSHSIPHRRQSNKGEGFYCLFIPPKSAESKRLWAHRVAPRSRRASHSRVAWQCFMDYAVVSQDTQDTVVLHMRYSVTA